MNEHSEVDLWQRHLDLERADRRSVEAYLSAEETQRANMFRFPKDRLRFILRHAHLRDVLARYLEISPGQVPLQTRLNQRPRLLGSASTGDLCVSLSSSEDQSVVAVACRRRVGVDIERVRSDLRSAEIARRLFSSIEYADLQALRASQSQHAFFRIWVRKEAFAKAIGLGFARDFTSFDVLPVDSRYARKDQVLINDRETAEEDISWLVKDVPTRTGFALACCAEGEDWSIVSHSDASL